MDGSFFIWLSTTAIPTKRKFFFREARHREAYEKRIWSDFKGKVRFPLWLARDRRALPLRGIHPFRENSSLKPLLFFRGREPKSAVFGSLRIPYKRAMLRASRESLRINIEK